MVDVNVRNLIGAGIPVVAVILLFIAMFTHGWFSVEESENYSEWDESSSYDYQFGLFGATVKYTYSWEGVTESGSESFDYSDEDDTDDLSTAGIITFVFLLIGTILTFGFITLGILGGLGLFNKMGGFGGFLPFIVGCVAGIMLLVAVIYAPIGQSGALEDIMGDEYPGGFVSYSWFLALFGMLMVFTGAALSIRIIRKGPKIHEGPIDYSREIYGHW